MSNYIQKSDHLLAQVRVDKQIAEHAVSQRIWDRMIGSDREVKGLGRCQILALDQVRRVARVMKPTGDFTEEGELVEEYEVSFSAILI